MPSAFWRVKNGGALKILLSKVLQPEVVLYAITHSAVGTKICVVNGNAYAPKVGTPKLDGVNI